MAHAVRIFGNAVLPDAFAQIVSAVLGVGARKRDGDHHHPGPLDAATMRDLGVRREYQDYSSSADVLNFAAGHLHRIADATRWGSPR